MKIQEAHAGFLNGISLFGFIEAYSFSWGKYDLDLLKEGEHQTMEHGYQIVWGFLIWGGQFHLITKETLSPVSRRLP